MKTDLGHSDSQNKRFPSKLPVVVLKSGAKKDAQMLAVFVTHPIFEMGNQTKDDVDSWFSANVDKEKTENVVSKYFILLFYKELESQKRNRKSTRGRVYNWMGGAKIKGWKARIDAIISLAEEKFQSD